MSGAAPFEPYGRGGNDNLSGGNVNDLLDGGRGRDTLNGLLGLLGGAWMRCSCQQASETEVLRILCRHHSTLLHQTEGNPPHPNAR
ncbi:hypothetical protein DDE18_19840 [Nocardioides gansuensis]|uniref:Uncharacterized protein n=1 Tax=Nocardioides gansuensis TaxID=2138300 RepID=A0A2T8F5T8_9ACTN|nr:hypothetical protein DDE18_19840 [Nocardioides gansuensis]